MCWMRSEPRVTPDDMEDCAHVWTAYTVAERKMFKSSDDVCMVTVRECVHCGLVDEGRDE